MIQKLIFNVYYSSFSYILIPQKALLLLLYEWAKIVSVDLCFFYVLAQNPNGVKFKILCIIIFYNNPNKQIVNYLNLACFTNLQDLTPYLLAIDKIQPCGYKTPGCHGSLDLSASETPPCAPEWHLLGNKVPLQYPPALGVPLPSSPSEGSPSCKSQDGLMLWGSFPCM